MESIKSDVFRLGERRAEICIENLSEISLIKISYNHVTEYDRI
jgi:hypothetical protein